MESPARRLEQPSFRRSRGSSIGRNKMRKLLLGFAVLGMLALAAPAQASGQTPEGTLTVSITTAATGTEITATVTDLYLPQEKKGSYAYVYVECSGLPPHYVSQLMFAPGGTFTFTDTIAETCGVYLIARIAAPAGYVLTLYTLGDIDVTFV
jgi:hypothetical protein